MKLSHEIPPGGEGYWYLASPFTNYPKGHKQAWLDISLVRGKLLQRGILGYSPICETWGAVQQLKLPGDHRFWRADNLSKMRPAVGLIMVELDSWQLSAGMTGEHSEFEQMGKPIVWCNPYWPDDNAPADCMMAQAA